MSNSESIVVAVDGPSASGKSTVSHRVAEALGFIYVDSGSLYRGVTWKAIRRNIPVRDTPRVLALLGEMQLDFFVESRAVVFTIDGEYPGQQLRSAPVRECVADIAAVPEVRSFIVGHLRAMTRFGPIVMEGRDIGSVVFPDTPFKFYLDADPDERARRRHQELMRMEGRSDVDEVFDSLKRRDEKDASRPTAPLQIALGARVINSTTMTIDEVVAWIVEAVRSAGVKA
jgi:cytidylate kinase